MKQQKGQILAISALFLSVIVLLVAVLVSLILGNNYLFQKRYQQKISFNVAEAGLDKTLQELNNNFSFSGETVTLSNGTYITTVTPISGNIKQVESVGYFPDAINPKSTKTVRTQVEINTDDIAFHYGVQVGEGGLSMNNNSIIKGNLYSNGSITGSGEIQGTAQVATGSQYSYSHEVQSLGADGDYIFGKVTPELDASQSFKTADTAPVTMVSLKLKKSCQNNLSNRCPGNLTLRILADNAGSPDKNNVIATGTLNQSLVSMSDYGWTNVTIDTPVNLIAGTTYWLTLSPSDAYPTGNNDRYWWWAKDKNQGYGNGVGKYSPDWNAVSPSWIQITGDLNFKVFLATNTTYMSGIHVTQSAYAYDIRSSTIDQDAYYTLISDTNVSGSTCPNAHCHPDTPAPALANMPISEANITDWKNDAIAGGTQPGDYTLDATSGSLGPKEITGNLTVINNAILKITGTVYVHGNINLSNNSEIYLDSSYGGLSGLIIADGTINISNNIIFCGSGYIPATKTCDTTNKSYIMLLSTSSADPAISVANNAKAVVFYAANGGLILSNNSGVYEATAYKLTMANNAVVTYESGLANATFSSGPGASWSIKKGTWQEL